jgi:uncharacterized membrane protein YedE/YeeE
MEDLEMSERPPIDWRLGGLLLGLVFFLAVALVKPIGVSTQFVVLDGILWNAVDEGAIVAGEDGLTSPSPYVGKYADNIADPLNYGFVFVLALAAGAGVSSVLRRGVSGAERTIPRIWRANMGDGVSLRMTAALLGGVAVVYGARLAGGCTSGHMMSGMMQTAVSGYLFSLGAFAAAVPVAVYIYRSEG